ADVLQRVERYEPAELGAGALPAEDDVVNADSTISNPDAQVAPASNIAGDPDFDSQRAANEDTLNTSPTAQQAQSNAAADDDFAEAITRQSSDGSLQNDDVGRVEVENERTGSIEGKDIVSEADPYAAPGIRAGSFVLRPTFEAGARYSNNPNDPACDGFANRAESSLLLRAESDWAQNALNVEAKVDLRKAFSNDTGLSNVDTFESGFRLAVDGRIDVTGADQITASASFDHSREVLDTSAISTFSQRPMVNTLRGAVGYSHDAGLIGLGANLQVSRQTYSDALDIAGVAVDQDDRNVTNVTGTLRASYELSPVFTPFVEAELGRRIFDNELDAAGIANSATRYALRAGSTVDFGEKLNGEIAAGWFVENIDDPSLRNISGFDFRGTMNWSPVRLTNVALTLGTQVDSARVLGSSTSVLHSGSVEFTRKLRDNLDANALFSASFRDFQGSEASLTTLTAQAGATWWLNRYSGIKGSVQHSTSSSSDPTRDRSSNGVYLGVILRR
ncbi:MAG: outer membrane beta-barrel protein, partial [Rhizobiaceae bacterium]